MTKHKGVKMRQLLLLIIILSGLTLPALAQEPPPLSDPLIVPLEGIMPEGVEYYKYQDFFIMGSLTTGSLYRVGPELAPEVWIEDPDLRSSVGLEVDQERLLVTNSDSSVFFDQESAGLASLAAYDIETGQRLFLTDLGALLPEERHFANDVTVDSEGNAYVTDSFAPVIYRVDPNGQAEIFLQDEAFRAVFLGLNGIVYHPDGFLLASMVETGTLYKIPLDDPTQFSIVAMETPIGFDGMAYGGYFLETISIPLDGSPQELITWASEDDWASMGIITRSLTGGEATTIAIRNGQTFYINAYLNNPNQSQYEIVPFFWENLPD
jgi:hypothetical protein